jgi:hypothetical protein
MYGEKPIHPLKQAGIFLQMAGAFSSCHNYTFMTLWLLLLLWFTH